MIKKIKLEDQLMEINRGVVGILTKKELIDKLNEERPLNIKFGVDPTAPDIHFGHTIPLQKLKQFQDLGHNIQLVIGDYTAMIGDPSGKSETRPMITKDQIEKNLETYNNQVFKILDKNRTQLFYNSSWLSQFSGTDILELGKNYTVQQLLQRRDFNERIKNNKPLSITELLYPLLVGYDSVHLKSDVEIGGTDQLFNFMASREIQKKYGQKPEVVITLPLLEGLDGIRKMSKSLGNTIGVNDTPEEMFGKIMSISDDLMIKYYGLLSNKTAKEIAQIQDGINNKGINPIEYKETLARELVTRYHDSEASEYAQDNFNKIYRERKNPENLDTYNIDYSTSSLSIIELLRNMGKADSNGEARRLIGGGGVKLNGEKITDINYILKTKDEQTIQVGKRFHMRLHFQRI